MAKATDEKTYALFSTPANKKIIAELTKRTVKFFAFPPLETEKNILDKTKIEYLQAVKAFDWIVFTDLFATDFFLQNLSENEVDLFEMDAVKVCAFGEAVSDRLRFSQLHADVIPVLIETENIISDLTNYLNEQEFTELKFLVVKEISRKFAVEEKLIAKGAKVFELPVYDAKITNKNEAAKLKTLLKGGAIDEFVFSDAADFFALQFYFPAECLSDVFTDIKISATGENAFQTAKEFGLRPLYFLLPG